MQNFDQHLRLAGAMLFLQTCTELTGTSPQDVAMVAGNIRAAAEKALVSFLTDDVLEWKQKVAEEEWIELA